MRLIGGASAENTGWLELATADDATEPIYVRQYEFIGGTDLYSRFGKLIRTATLLDEAGNTSFLFIPFSFCICQKLLNTFHPG